MKSLSTNVDAYKERKEQFLYHCVLYGTITVRMPKPGYKSITVKEHIYNKYEESYNNQKKQLERKGISSFSGYITSLMEEAMLRHETFAKYAPFLEKLAVEQDRIIIKDNKINRIVEVMIKDGQLQCLLDEKTDCIHIGFVYAIPEIYPVLEGKKERGGYSSTTATSAKRRRNKH